MQTVFLLEKMLLELGKAAKVAFGREVCRAKLHSKPAYVGPSGPWTLQRAHTQTPLYKPRCFHAAWPGWALGPGPFKGPCPSSVLGLQALEYYFKRLWCEAGRGDLEPGPRVPLRMEP